MANRRARVGTLLRSLRYYDRLGDAARVEHFAAQLRALGRCVRCGRELSDPESIARGIGPDCLVKAS